MKKEIEPPDPLGRRPAPATGDLKPRHLDDAMRVRSEVALAAAQAVWIRHREQEVVIAEIRSYLGTWRLADDRSSCGGRGLSQYSQAGKSATMRRLRRVLAEVSAAAGLPANPYQVVIVTLRKKTTVNQLYRAILKALGDTHWDEIGVSAATLLSRLEEHSTRLGMELLVVDEVQHLDSTTRDAKDVQDQLKVFLDEAYFPIVFVGDEDAKGFFERNGKFAARLGELLDLRPMRPTVKGEAGDADAAAFKLFCRRFDRALQRSGAIGRTAGLDRVELLTGLLQASGGHVGRVARILQVAVKHAAWRNAETVDAYDLSHAVRAYAIKNRWIAADPFSTPC